MPVREHHLVVTGQKNVQQSITTLFADTTKRDAIAENEKKYRERYNVPNNIQLRSRVLISGTEDEVKEHAIIMHAFLTGSTKIKE